MESMEAIEIVCYGFIMICVTIGFGAIFLTMLLGAAKWIWKEMTK